MATYTAGPTYNAKDPYLEFQLNETVYSDSNSSVLNWVLILHRPSAVSSSNLKTWMIIIDGETFTSASNIAGSGDLTLSTGYKEVKHGSDGKKTIAYTFSIDLSSINWIGYGYLTELKGIGTFKLTDIQLSHTVTYDANGGTNVPEPQIKTYGTPLIITNTKPELEGKYFVNWNTKSDGSGSSYYPGDSYTSESDLLLYAIWSENSVYDITFDANGGLIYIPGIIEEDIGQYYNKYVVSINVGDKFTIPNYIITKEQGENSASNPASDDDSGTSTDPDEPFEKFQGWSRNKDSKTIEYVPGDTISFDTDTILYAVYSPEKYTVTFYDGYNKDTEFGKMIVSYSDILYGASVDPPKDPSRPGYVFQGWSSEAYKNVISNINIQALWDFAPIWIRSNNRWIRYNPEE